VSAEVHQGETKEQKEKEKAKTDIQEVRDKIHKEYAAALDHEGMHTQGFSSFFISRYIKPSYGCIVSIHSGSFF